MVDVDAVTRWGEIPPPQDDDALSAALLDDSSSSPYPLNEEINFKVALWQGDLTALKADALVNSNNQELNERSGVSGQIFAAAGPQLEEACTKLGSCRPGDAKATRGFRLPAKHVVHTVPPQWTDKGDAEAVLEACYTRSFEVARKLASSTIVFTCVKTSDAPRELVAHVAVRTIRRLLEQHGRSLQLIIFAMRPQVVPASTTTYHQPMQPRTTSLCHHRAFGP
jgi:O-acetyl-ADP-ribose deacetylase